MLSQTKELQQDLINKVQLLEFVLTALQNNHKDYSGRVEEQFKQASNHKLKLTDELLRISGADKLESEVKPKLEVEGSVENTGC